MRARRSAYERSGEGFLLRPVIQERPGPSDGDGQSWLAAAGSVLLHAALLTSLLLLSRGAPPGEVQGAPSFAVQFDTGASSTPASAPPSEARVNLGDSDAPPPPPVQTSSADAIPLPPFHYGSARKPRNDNNPFSRIVPFNLSNTASRPSAFGRPSSQLDLSAGPVVRQGKITDAITHPRGSQVSGDYDGELIAFVEAHREQIQISLEKANEGRAVLQVTIARDGHVLRMHLLRPSGSILLDAAWVAFFRDYALPPLSADITGDEYTFAYELDYSIIYGPPPH